MLAKLRKILPVPPEPVDTDSTMLGENLNKLGLAKLPDDYVEYGCVYGSGVISVGVYSWEIFSPFRKTYPKFIKTFYEIHDEYRRALEISGLPFGLFPEPGGLLPFGRRDDVKLCWKTEGAVDKWKVVVIWRYDEGGYQEFDLNFVTFLMKLLTRKIAVAGYTSSWNPKNDITFRTEIYGS